MSKLSLVFVEKKTWESWISVFDAWERGELIREDGKDPTLIPRLPRAHITNTDVAPTLGLRDSDLVLLAKEILENKFALRPMLPAGIASRWPSGTRRRSWTA
jgi:hypothetical protein